jgi:rod shape determining protein RodA
LKPILLSLKALRFFSRGEHPRIDWITPICLLLISVTSIIFIYSAQSYSSGNHWAKQGLWLAVGGLLYLGISSMNYKLLLENAHFIFIAGIILLIMVQFFGVEISGSKRWIDLKVFKLQPTEGAKIGTLILGASILARSEITTLKESWKVIAKVGLTFAAPILLIFLQPDLGSTLIFPPMMFALLYVARVPKRFFATVFGIFAFLLVLVSVDMVKYHEYLVENDLAPRENNGGYQVQSWLPMKDYQRNRILAFVAPDIVDPRGIGVSWNLRQSLISVGSGGITGKGWQEGTQAKLGYLPPAVAHNDFIFSVIAEESGFAGSVFIVFLYATMLVNSIRIASQARDRFGVLLVVGVSVIFFIHIFINIGMTIGMMPITGLPLPFLSYGGSFVLSCFILQGLVQSVYRYRRDYS